MASSREADFRLDRANASRTISDLVRREIAAVASSWANSGLESLTVIVGMQLSYYLLQQFQYGCWANQVDLMTECVTFLSNA